jgi:hypothetical protein
VQVGIEILEIGLAAFDVLDADKAPITFSPCSAIAAPTLADVRVWVESDPNPSRRELASYFAVC